MTSDALVRTFLAIPDEHVSASVIPAQLSVSITEKASSLSAVVKMLGDSLTSEDNAKRARGIGLLAAILTQLPKTCINRPESLCAARLYIPVDVLQARYFTDFFTSSSTLDGSSLVQALDGLNALAQLPLFGQGDTKQVVRAIFQHVEMMKHHQSVRFLVYQLLDTLMARHRAAFQDMGSEFLKDYATLVDGEKDPRNLKMAFSIDRTILLEFDISACIEDLFDITFCYFPITFTPPPDDPYGITSEDLQTMLRGVLSSNALLGPLALPLILEKLAASSKSAKRQSMELLRDAMPVYGEASLRELAMPIWKALSLEVLNATDPELEELACTAINVFLSVFYTSEDLNEDGDLQIVAKQAVLDHISQVCLTEIKEPEKSNAKSAAKILGVAVSCSDFVNSILLPKAMHAFLDLLRDSSSPDKRTASIELLGGLFAALNASGSSRASSIQPVKDEVLSFLQSSAQIPSSAATTFHTLEQLVLLPEVLTLDDVSLVVSTLNSTLTPSADGQTSAAALKALQTIAEFKPALIEASTCQQLFISVPHEASQDDSYKFSLNALTQLCMPSDLFEFFILRLLSRIEAVQQSNQGLPEDRILFTHHLLLSMRSAIRMKAAKTPADISKCVPRAAPRLFSAFSNSSAEPKGSSGRLMEEAARVVALLLQHTDSKYQQEFVETVLSPYVLADTFTSTSHAILCSWSTIPLHLKAIERRIDHLTHLFSSTALRHPDPLARKASCAALACLINKHASSVDAASMTDALCKSRSNSAQNVLAWVVRALIPLNDASAYVAIDHLISNFSDSDLGTSAAQGFQTFSVHADEIVSKQHNCKFKLLYKQKYYSMALSKLIAAHKSTKDDNSLIALAWLVQGMPNQLCLTELPKERLSI